MAYYSDDIIEEVCSRNDIVDVISQHVTLTKKGSSLFGLCPFHNEKSPSFSVSPSKQMYYCFGCGAGGNVITFVREYENYSFTEAMEYLADRASIILPKQEETPQAKRQSDLRTKLLEINKLAAKYYYFMLRQNEGRNAGYEYIKNRNITDDTINKFGLGYAGVTSDNLYKYMKNQGYSDELLNQSGLFNKDKKNNFYDKFWNRVIFPIMNVNNKVVGFGGRVMGKGEPKYLNSPETKIFDKSRNLYGLNMARTSRRQNIIVCEGYIDVIMMHQAGFDNAVASLGTAFTLAHASLLKRYTDEVILSYDSDAAGVKAALRAIPILKESGITAKVLNLKPYKDPDEFIKNFSAEEFELRISKARNSFLFEIDDLKDNYNLNDPEEKTKFHIQTAKRLLRFEEELERNNYIEAVADEYEIGFENLRRLVNKFGLNYDLGASDTVTVNKTEKTKEKDGMKQSQKLLLTWMIEDSKLYNIVKRYIEPEDFTDELYKRAAKILYSQFEEGKVNPAIIINHFENEEEQRRTAELFNAKLEQVKTKADFEKALNETIYRVKENSIEYAARNESDIDSLLKLVENKKTLEELKKLHISID